MITPAEACVLAAAVIVLVLIVVVLVRRGRRGEGYMPGDPATPKLREAVGLLAQDLACITQTADAVGRQEKKIAAAGAGAPAGAPIAEARATLAAARLGAAAIVEGARRLEARLRATPPTYQNVLGLYQGLRDSDAAYWRAAEALDLAAVRMQGLVALEAAPGDARQLAGEIDVAARQLRGISTCVYGFVRSVHYLGGALMLE